MQARGRLIQNIKGFTRIFFGQFSSQFYPLRFTSRKGSGVLPKGYVAQAHLT